LKNTLFLITARGGSKGIPGKNIKLLHNKSLINYSIDLAREFVSDEYICVSTDSAEISKVAENNGLHVPFVRPAELATDTAGSYEVIKHALHFYEDKLAIDKIVLLQPTTPFRLKKQVADCISTYTKDCDMVVSVNTTKANPYQLLYIENQQGFIEKVIKGTDFERRQDLPKVFQINGAVYVYNVQSLKDKHIRDFNKIRHYEMPELNSLDIDEPLDWLWAEFLMEKKIITLDYA
jgi:CMP-N,N'-diacetyllegionaminic acid synthase